LRDKILDFVGVGESTGDLLGVDGLPIQVDFKHSTRALDQLRLDVETTSYLVRQTGGSRIVVSNNAVFDRDCRHRNDLPDAL
jgi:hypothetical protein